MSKKVAIYFPSSLNYHVCCLLWCFRLIHLRIPFSLFYLHKHCWCPCCPDICALQRFLWFFLRHGYLYMNLVVTSRDRVHVSFHGFSKKYCHICPNTTMCIVSYGVSIWYTYLGIPFSLFCLYCWCPCCPSICTLQIFLSFILRRKFSIWILWLPRRTVYVVLFLSSLK